jgi:23S rRNA (guanosine2251-2'-O)-methyltransferase
MKEKIVILHDIRSTHNVGSIFRTADGAGVYKIYLTGYTPTPKDRFDRWRKDISKVALGAERTISWEYHRDIKVLIKSLKEEGFDVVAVEQNKDSINYKTFKLKNKTAFIFGNEVEGVSQDILDEVDNIIEIEMLGEKESLNVSVTAGIILFNM